MIHPPLSFFVDVFSSSMSRVCFSISPVYCSTCSLSILIWLSLSWTAFRAFTNNSKWSEFMCKTEHTKWSALSPLRKFMKRKQEGRLRIRHTWQMKLTLQSSYMTWPRAAIERWEGGQVDKTWQDKERKQKVGKMNSKSGFPCSRHK